jgi:membrane protease YdiL (CAAX protease family)
MRAQQINRVSGKILIILSFIALLTVLSGYFQPPQPDEGAGAHIFQISVVALVPTILLFLTTADWKKPSRNARLLAFTGVTMVVAFGALYYLEHYFYVERFR